MTDSSWLSPPRRAASVKAVVLPLGYAVVRRYGVTPTYHYRYGDRA